MDGIVSKRVTPTPTFRDDSLASRYGLLFHHTQNIPLNQVTLSTRKPSSSMSVMGRSVYGREKAEKEGKVSIAGTLQKVSLHNSGLLQEKRKSASRKHTQKLKHAVAVKFQLPCVCVSSKFGVNPVTSGCV